MEKYVTSRELAQRLKEAGFPQTTLRYWERYKDVDGMWKVHLATCKAWETSEYNAAPLSDELLEQLPHEITIKDVTYYLGFGWPPKSKTFVASYSNAEVDAVYAQTDGLYDSRTALKRADNLPDALAQLWLYCHDNGLLPNTTEGKKNA